MSLINPGKVRFDNTYADLRDPDTQLVVESGVLVLVLTDSRIVPNEDWEALNTELDQARIDYAGIQETLSATLLQLSQKNTELIAANAALAQARKDLEDASIRQSSELLGLLRSYDAIDVLESKAFLDYLDALAERRKVRVT